MITLFTLESSTRQEVLDQAAKFLLLQSEKCASESGTCRYKHEGKSCVAGCFISMDEYNPAMEGQTWDDLVSSELVPSDHSELIFDLQDIHDNSRIKDWKINLLNLADKYDLETTVIDCFDWSYEDEKWHLSNGR